MEVRAVGRGFRVPPRKVRVVAREVRGKHAVVALAELGFHPSKGARLLRKVLKSAVANATENDGLSADSLVISRIDVDEGPRLKRIRARAMGRANRILKRSSHITVVLSEGEPFEVSRTNDKPKPRPKFELTKTAKKQVATSEIESQPAADEREAADTASGVNVEPAGTEGGDKP